MTEFTESDFDEYALADEGEVFIKDPKTGKQLMFKGEPVSVPVFGPASKDWAREMHVMEKRTTQELTALAMAGKEINDEAVAESSSKRTRELVIALAKEVKNFPYPGGKAAILSAPKFNYIYKQVEEYLNKMGNFYGVKKQP